MHGHTSWLPVVRYADALRLETKLPVFDAITNADFFISARKAKIGQLLVTTSKAPVPSSVALVTSSFLLLLVTSKAPVLPFPFSLTSRNSQ